MSLVPFERHGRPLSCSCGAILETLIPPTDGDAALLVCRNPEHGRHPMLWIVYPGIRTTAALLTDVTARRLAAEVIAKERDLSEIVGTGTTTRPDAMRHHGAGDPGDLPPGAVAGVKVGPEDRGVISAELRQIADELDAMSTVLDRERSQRLVARVERAFADATREADDIANTFAGSGPYLIERRSPQAPARMGRCDCGWVGPWEDPGHDLRYGTHHWKEIPR